MILCEAPPRPAIGPEAGIGTRASYDVTRDGQEFIVAEARGGSAANAPFTILVNWRSVAAKGVRPASVGAR